MCNPSATQTVQQVVGEDTRLFVSKESAAGGPSKILLGMNVNNTFCIYIDCQVVI